MPHLFTQRLKNILIMEKAKIAISVRVPKMLFWVSSVFILSVTGMAGNGFIISDCNFYLVGIVRL
jgi:hypothetical protein